MSVRSLALVAGSTNESNKRADESLQHWTGPVLITVNVATRLEMDVGEFQALAQAYQEQASYELEM